MVWRCRQRPEDPFPRRCAPFLGRAALRCQQFPTHRDNPAMDDARPTTAQFWITDLYSIVIVAFLSEKKGSEHLFAAPRRVQALPKSYPPRPMLTVANGP